MHLDVSHARAPLDVSRDPRDHARIRGLLDSDRCAEACAEADRLLRTAPDDDSAHLARGQALLGLSDPAEALRAADRAAALAPRSGPAQRLRAVTLRGLRRTSEAVVAVTTATELDPDDWRNHALLAEILADSPGLLPMARRAAAQAVRLQPDEAAVHVVTGYVAQASGRRRAARAAYERALGLDPQHPAALLNLGLLERRRSRTPER